MEGDTSLRTRGRVSQKRALRVSALRGPRIVHNLFVRKNTVLRSYRHDIYMVGWCAPLFTFGDWSALLYDVHPV
jgi:hypothetical protein